MLSFCDRSFSEFVQIQPFHDIRRPQPRPKKAYNLDVCAVTYRDHFVISQPENIFLYRTQLVRPQVLPAALSTLAKWCKVLESVSCVDVSLSLFHTCSLVLSFLPLSLSFSVYLSLSQATKLSLSHAFSLSLSLSLSQAVSKIKQR